MEYLANLIKGTIRISLGLTLIAFVLISTIPWFSHLTQWIFESLGAVDSYAFHVFIVFAGVIIGLSILRGSKK